jgi:hypothetical protein
MQPAHLIRGGDHSVLRIISLTYNKVLNQLGCHGRDFNRSVIQELKKRQLAGQQGNTLRIKLAKIAC